MKRTLLLLSLTSLLAGHQSSALTLEEAVRECPVPYAVMWAVAKAEDSERPGYPFVIRINDGRVKIPWLKKIGKNAYDCKSYEVCVYTARKLIEMGITNVDLGPFQINYRYHHFPPEEAFRLPDSYLKACEILARKVRKYGWNWKGVAAYHSASPEENEKYAQRLKEIMRQALQEH